MVEKSELLRLIIDYDAAHQAVATLTNIPIIIDNAMDLTAPRPGHELYDAYVQARSRLAEAELRLWNALPGTDVPGWSNAVAYDGRLYMTGRYGCVTVACGIVEDLDGSARSLIAEAVER